MGAIISTVLFSTVSLAVSQADVKNLTAHRAVQEQQVRDAAEAAKNEPDPTKKKQLEAQVAIEQADVNNANSAIDALNKNASEAGTSFNAEGKQYQLQFDDKGNPYGAFKDASGGHYRTPLENINESNTAGLAGTEKGMSGMQSSTSLEGQPWKTYQGTIGGVNSAADGAGVQHVFSSEAPAVTGSEKAGQILNLKDASVWSNGSAITGNSINLGSTVSAQTPVSMVNSSANTWTPSAAPGATTNGATVTKVSATSVITQLPMSAFIKSKK